MNMVKRKTVSNRSLVLTASVLFFWICCTIELGLRFLQSGINAIIVVKAAVILGVIVDVVLQRACRQLVYRYCSDEQVERMHSLDLSVRVLKFFTLVLIAIMVVVDITLSLSSSVIVNFFVLSPKVITVALTLKLANDIAMD